MTQNARRYTYVLDSILCHFISLLVHLSPHVCYRFSTYFDTRGDTVWVHKKRARYTATQVAYGWSLIGGSDKSAHQTVYANNS